ncbi:MAG: hypothetical protein KJ799_11455 [Bacteroidetes bacterium]|nr:hypothetical protein [Bacteroidota bacterium]MBU1679951.1 hypothetical protein [Bacteroidota bacterium]MBU2507324.1 hypothetical protein [Bacteroidota bacterium]
MKKIISMSVVISQLFFISCNDDITSPLNDFQISDYILEGYFVTSIVFDSKDIAWIATFKQGLIKYDGSITLYDASNSTLPDSLFIWDLAVDNNDVLWIGSSKGLIKFEDDTFHLYNKSNAPLITANVFTLTIDDNNNIWFSSCVFKEGGIMKFDGLNWTLFTPQNSAFPGSLLGDIMTDGQNNIWAAVNDGINTCSIAKISGENISIFSEEEIGIPLYYFGELACGAKNHIYAALDYSLSSSADINRPHIISFDGKKWKIINPVDKKGKSLGYVNSIAVDLKGNLWANTSLNGIVVYNGQNWIFGESKIIIESSVFDIAVDSNNNIWIGSGDGIYIIK